MPKKKFHRALGRWALDSGGFTELSTFGQWTVSTSQYAREVERFSAEVGNLDFAAPMDWMCEPAILAKTGLTVREHQARTIDNFMDLRSRLGTVVIPVLQGWEIPEYIDHIGQYQDAGITLSAEPIVGVGTVCRRQDTVTAETLFRELASLGIAIHGFGVKEGGLRRSQDVMASSDSMAWSFAARMERPGCGNLSSCANCLHYALSWRQKLLNGLASAPVNPQMCLWT